MAIAMIVLALQILAAFLLGFSFYMVAMVLTVYDGILSLILQPIAATIVTIVSMLITGLVGSPLRIFRPLNSWWRARWWIPIILGTLAFGLMVLSFVPQFQVSVLDPDLEIFVSMPNPYLALSGWFLTIFAALHFYPPTFRLSSRQADTQG